MKNQYNDISLKGAASYSPSFYASLLENVESYSKSVEKLSNTYLYNKKCLKYSTKFVKYLKKSSESFQMLSSLHQLHSPLLNDIIEKFNQVNANADAFSESIIIFDKTCVDSLNNNIARFNQFINLKHTFEKSHNDFFSKLLTSNDTTPMNDDEFNQLTNSYKALVLEMVYFLRSNVRDLDEALYISSTTFLKQISTFFPNFVNAVNIHETSVLEFILANNNREKEEDADEIRNLNISPNPKIFQPLESRISLSNLTSTNQTQSTKPEASPRSLATSALNFFDSFIPKIINKNENTPDPPQVPKVVYEYGIELNLDNYIFKSVPSFINGFKYDIPKPCLVMRDSYDLEGYLRISGTDFADSFKNDKLLLLLLDKKGNVLLGQGIEDPTPTHMFLLCHCIVIENSITTSSKFEIYSYNRQITVNAFTSSNKNKWVTELRNSIKDSLKEIKYKLKGFHLFVDNNDVVYESAISVLYTVEGNDFCADCNAKDPEWINYHIGVTVCSECAGGHRSYGSSNNHIRSLLHDYWNDKNFDHVLSLGGNRSINLILEAQLKTEEKPTPQSSMQERIDFIGNKYHKKLYK